MSREVRRVPLGWKHPTEPNPYWYEQAASRIRRGAPESQLHAAQERFVGLCDDYTGRLAEWERELADMKARRGRGWEFQVEYHLTGYQAQKDEPPVIHPWYEFGTNGETEISIPVRDQDHLHELVIARVESERPDPADYMPTFASDELGWCLYETVSEGTPVTPVFATADELVEHLVTVGQDLDRTPMRREAAQQLVASGHSFGSLVVIGGTVYDSASDCDKISDALAGGGQ